MRDNNHNPLLFDAMDHYIRWTENGNTRDYYEKKARVIKRFGKNVPVEDIDRVWVIDFIERRLTAMPEGRATCRKEVNFVRYVQEFLGIPVNWVAPRHYFSRSGKRVSYVPTDAEFVALWNECDKQCRALIAACIFGGLRKSEVSRMKRGFVDEANGVLNIPGEVRKTSRPNRLPLSSVLYGSLQRAGCLSWRPAEEPLFRFLGKDLPTHRIRTAAKRAGIARSMKGFQVFRRLLLRWLTELGYAEAERSMITGHVPVNSASVYADNPEGYMEIKTNMLLALEGKWREMFGKEDDD